MKSFLAVLITVLPISFASAKSVTINEVDEFTYTEIVAYKDGTREVHFPKMYNYFFGSPTRGEAEDNANAVCIMIGSSRAIHHTSFLTGKGRLTTVLYRVENGQLSEPKFGRGGQYETMILSKVLCR